MVGAFLEVILKVSDLESAGIESRDEVDEPLNSALRAARLGRVSGGGSGMGLANIDVDLTAQSDSELAQALELIRSVLQSLQVPPSTRIVRHSPARVEYPVYQ